MSKSRKPESPCLTTAAIAGPCAACAEYQRAGVHLVGSALFCASHCPICKPLSHDWGGAKEAGEQMELVK